MKRQSPELEENWSYIHFLENIENLKKDVYSSYLETINKERPSLTSLILLRRYLNSLEKYKYSKWVNLLKEISDNNQVSSLVKSDHF